jgi:hypothetical protein
MKTIVTGGSARLAEPVSTARLSWLALLPPHAAGGCCDVSGAALPEPGCCGEPVCDSVRLLLLLSTSKPPPVSGAVVVPAEWWRWHTAQHTDKQTPAIACNSRCRGLLLCPPYAQHAHTWGLKVGIVPLHPALLDVHRVMPRVRTPRQPRRQDLVHTHTLPVAPRARLLQGGAASQRLAQVCGWVDAQQGGRREQSGGRFAVACVVEPLLSKASPESPSDRINAAATLPTHLPTAAWHALKRTRGAPRHQAPRRAHCRC